MIFTCTTKSENPDLNDKSWVDGEHGTTVRVGFLAGLLGPGEALTVTITEGIVLPQTNGGGS